MRFSSARRLLDCLIVCLFHDRLGGVRSRAAAPAGTAAPAGAAARWPAPRRRQCATGSSPPAGRCRPSPRRPRCAGRDVRARAGNPGRHPRRHAGAIGPEKTWCIRARDSPFRASRRLGSKVASILSQARTPAATLIYCLFFLLSIFLFSLSWVLDSVFKQLLVYFPVVQDATRCIPDGKCVSDHSLSLLS